MSDSGHSRRSFFGKALRRLVKGVVVDEPISRSQAKRQAAAQGKSPEGWREVQMPNLQPTDPYKEIARLQAKLEAATEECAVACDKMNILSNALKHCISLAGNPDAEQGCRNVIARAEAALGAI